MKHFGAIAGKRNAFDTANVPGAELTLGKQDTAQAPTKGRSLDHMGFEVKNLDQFTKTLQADGIQLEAPGVRASANAPNLRIAYIFDPWGTYIELTEGLTPKGAARRGLAIRIPDRLRPSPLRLIWLNHQIPGDQLDPQRILFSFLDFDAF